MEEMKNYSEIEQFEIINIQNGEKYSCIGDNDILIDEYGNFKKLVITKNNSKFTFFSNNEFYEVDWSCVSKIGSSMIILDANETEMKVIRY